VPEASRATARQIGHALGSVTLSNFPTKNIYTSGRSRTSGHPLRSNSSVGIFGLSVSRTDFGGFGFGGGYVHKTRAHLCVGQRRGLSNLIKDQNELELRLFYVIKPWRFELNINNVTDKRSLPPGWRTSPKYDWYVNQPLQVSESHV